MVMTFNGTGGICEAVEISARKLLFDSFQNSINSKFNTFSRETPDERSLLYYLFKKHTVDSSSAWKNHQRVTNGNR